MHEQLIDIKKCEDALKLISKTAKQPAKNHTPVIITERGRTRDQLKFDQCRVK
jgi:hypothetical protein